MTMLFKSPTLKFPEREIQTFYRSRSKAGWTALFFFPKHIPINISLYNPPHLIINFSSHD
jgi:hypothetical protein